MIYAENILLCITIPLLLTLMFLRRDARRFAASFALGMGICLLSAYISGYLDLVTGMGENDTAIFLSPVVEELMKFLPLLVALFLLESGDSELVLYAVGIGAGFATFENCCHLLRAGADSLAFIMVRGLAVGVMHIVSMLTLALGLVIARRFHALSAPGIIGALSLSMIFHALYNLLVSGPGLSAAIGYALPLLTALALYFLTRRITPAVPEHADTD